MKSFFLVFLLAHLIGDFVFQTNKIAELKSKGVQGIVLHVLILTAVQCAMLTLFFGPVALLSGLLVGAFHFGIDYMKKLLSPHIRSFQTGYFVLDQGIHVGIIYVVTSLIDLQKERLIVDSQWLLFAIAIILCYFVGTILVKYLLLDFNMIQKERPFFEKNERMMDGLTTLILMAAFGNSIVLSIAVAVIAAVLYGLLQRRILNYQAQVIRLKYFVLILVAYGSLMVTTL